MNSGFMYLKILLVRGNYFHANCLFSLNTDAQKRNIYIPLLHIVSVNSHQLGLHTNSLKRFRYFGNKKRLDSYLMVQKTSVAVLSHGAIYFQYLAKRNTMNFAFCHFWWLFYPLYYYNIFFEKRETCPTIMNKETRDDNSLTVTLGFSR